MKYQRLRNEMVTKQIIARGISDPRVLSAMRTVPRHLFVSEAMMDQAYGDFPLPIGEQQTISQPYIVAEMTQALQVTPEDRVLEIGTGSGYQAAILAQIAFRVYTVERIYTLYTRTRKLFDQLRYHNLVTRYSDGTTGWKEHSPYRCHHCDCRCTGDSHGADQSTGHGRTHGDSGGGSPQPGFDQALS
jgi:protein-L-isoaspartate(D-aspartate) O-methyltransferase